MVLLPDPSDSASTTPDALMEASKANIGLVSLELNKNERSKHWMPGPPDPEEDVDHDLKLHQAIIGSKAAKGEEQVIEVELFSADRKKICLPLAYLTRGQTNQHRLEVQFPAGTLFRLVEGDGPVFLMGSHVISSSDDDIVDENIEEEEEEDDDEEHPDGHEIIGRDMEYEVKPPLDQGPYDENGSKKRKPDGERENGGEPKKLKSNQNANSSDLDEDGDDEGADGAME